MIPYFEYTAIPLGPVHIQVWGLFVALGIIVAVLVGEREAKRRGLDAAGFVDFSTWTIIAALVAARLAFVFAYQPAGFLTDDPWRIFRIWEGGMSSVGGFVGAFLGAAIYCRFAKVRFSPLADVAAYVLPLGYGIGRIGCFLIHDHPGVLSTLFLAVRYPDVPRLDHGLLLSLFGFAIFGFFVLLSRRRTAYRERGYLAWCLLIYGVGRFYLDFYRAWDLSGSDVRYWLLTPAQYGCLVMAAAGLYLLLRRRQPASVLAS